MHAYSRLGYDAGPAIKWWQVMAYTLLLLPCCCCWCCVAKSLVIKCVARGSLLRSMCCNRMLGYVSLALSRARLILLKYVCGEYWVSEWVNEWEREREREREREKGRQAGQKDWSRGKKSRTTKMCSLSRRKHLARTTTYKLTSVSSSTANSSTMTKHHHRWPSSHTYTQYRHTDTKHASHCLMSSLLWWWWSSSSSSSSSISSLFYYYWLRCKKLVIEYCCEYFANEHTNCASQANVSNILRINNQAIECVWVSWLL